MKTSTRILLAGAVASALAVPLIAANSEAKKAEGNDSKPVACYGVNKCKGVGDCGGATTSCMGTNSCKHQGFINMSKEICLKLDGGRLTANEK